MFVSMWKMQLPVATAYSLKVIALVEILGLTNILRPSCPHRQHAPAIDRIRGQTGSRDLGYRRQYIEQRCGYRRRCSGTYVTWPPDNEWHARSAFKGCALAFTKMSR